MNLQTHISNNLWLAIESTYKSKNYSHSILDAVHYISNVIREKTGIDGDGTSLIGQAFGGDSPRLKINKLQTETERNEQHGIENILRGLYQAIRNPRSHELKEDSQETADSVIYFINYLLSIIEKSEEPFVLSRFVDRVFDPDFYHSDRYVELLVGEIPKNKKLDTLIEIYRRKTEGDISNIGLVIQTILKQISDNEIKQFLIIVSEELKTTSKESEIRFNLHIIPPELWKRISETSRLRIENKILKKIETGEFYNGKCREGALATWAGKHFKEFELKKEIGEVLFEKLDSGSLPQQYYVVVYYLTYLPFVINAKYKISHCIAILSEKIREGDMNIRKEVINKINSLPEDWQMNFVNNLKDVTDKDFPEIYLHDGTPFLKMKISDEDIPF